MGFTGTAFFIYPTFLVVIYLSHVGLSADCSCKKVKFASCQKDALYYNRDFVARYTQESVESFSVDLYQEPIIQPTREQIKIVKRKYRNMFSYPTTVTADPPVVITPPGGETEIGVDPVFGVTVERNTTCTNTTERELFENWIRVTEMIECNTTDAFGYRGQSRHRSVKYLSPPERPSRSKRQLGKIKLCKADYIPPEQVLYTVSSTKGDPVQVMQMPGAYQDMGDISCTPASTIPRDIRCELEMVDSPKVVFKLRGKYIESENIRIPRCTAYQLL